MDLSTPVGCPLLEVYRYFSSICSSVGLPFSVSPDLFPVPSGSLVGFAAMSGGAGGNALCAAAGILGESGFAAMPGGLRANSSGLILERDAPGGAAAMFLALGGSCLF